MSLKGSTQRNKAGLYFLIGTIFSNIAGTGALFIPIILAQIGSISIISMALSGLSALLLAYSFSQLHFSAQENNASDIGFYEYMRLALNHRVAQVGCLLYAAGLFITDLFLILKLQGEFVLLFSNLNLPFTYTIGTVVTLILVSTSIISIRINRLGALKVASLITVICKVALLILVMSLSITNFNFANIINNFNLTSLSNGYALNRGLVITIFCFMGMESGAFLTSIAQNPKKDMSRAIVFGTALSALFYCLILFLFFGAIPASLASQYSGSVPSILVEKFLGIPGTRILVNLIVILACYGGLTSWIFNFQSFFAYLMERNVLPKISCQRKNPLFGIRNLDYSVTGEILLGFFFLIIVLFKVKVDIFLDISVVFLLTSFVIMMLSNVIKTWIVTQSSPGAMRVQKMFLPWLSLLYCVISLLAAVSIIVK